MIEQLHLGNQVCENVSESVLNVQIVFPGFLIPLAVNRILFVSILNLTQVPFFSFHHVIDSGLFLILKCYSVEGHTLFVV